MSKTYRQKFAPIIGRIILQNPQLTSKELRLKLKEQRPAVPPRCHPGRVWSSEVTRQMRFREQCLTAKPFRPKVAQPGPEQLNLF